jgi:hypothetical protein
MAQNTEYVAAREIKVGDILTHPYTTWEVTSIDALTSIDRYTFEVTPSNPIYETRLSVFGDAIFHRQIK